MPALTSVPAPDTLTYSVAGLPAGLSFVGSTISGTPTNDDVGSYTISVTANDGHSGSLTRTFSFSVANTNDAPVGTAASYTINEDSPLAGTVAGTDVDGDSLTFSLVAGSATNGAATVIRGLGKLPGTYKDAVYFLNTAEGNPPLFGE